ncbi:MAG: DEAD/DEAH box helicase [Armatimonadota bacterium]
MDPKSFVEILRKEGTRAARIAHVELIPSREAQCREVAGGLHPVVSRLLQRQGIQALFAHQASAVEAVREGHNVVVVTGTASGKTLCYNIPTAEALMENPLSTMLYIFPTKALAQDQLRGLDRFRDSKQGLVFHAGTYDGDTPADRRRRLRDSGNVILTNPDMLHQGILPHHARWHRFFTHLRYVVIDELHAYRGIFGSHLANVMRRLQRICAYCGSAPQYVTCSATIANPKEHAEKILGQPVVVIDNDGSPKGLKWFVLWNPGPFGSSFTDAAWIMSLLVSNGVQAIAFARTRLAAELVCRYCQEMLRDMSPVLAEAVCAYRGGYLPEERREIERRIASGETLGVVSTNALELGIDIGTLDAAIIVGYPGTVASLWQQAGRAGRARRDALVVMVAQNSPVDQYLVSEPGYLFAQSVEHAVVDPTNPHIASGHIKCAARELPLALDEAVSFTPHAEVILDLLEEYEQLKRVNDKWYWSSTSYPASDVNLRSAGGAVYAIQDASSGEQVIGTVDEETVFSQLHPNAVYIHGSETYLVTRLDIQHKIAHVRRQDVDYYTQAVQVSQIHLESEERREEWLAGCTVGLGDVTVTTHVPMFKKIKFQTRENVGYEQLDLPPRMMDTVAMWFTPSAETQQELLRRSMVLGEALIGVANVFVEVARLHVMCDPQDIDAVVESSCFGAPTLFVFDRCPGGVGYAERCLESLEQILHSVYRVVSECPCDDGCPSCVGAAVPAFAMSDIDVGVRDRIPDKKAARILLEMILGAQPGR